MAATAAAIGRCLPRQRRQQDCRDTERDRRGERGLIERCGVCEAAGQADGGVR
jgi:hypothetical protein